MWEGARPRSWGALVDRSLAMCAAGLIVVQLVVAFIGWSADPSHAEQPSFWALSTSNVMLIIALGLCCSRLPPRLLTTGVLLTAAAGLVSACALVQLHADPPTQTAHLHAAIALQVFQFVAFVRVRSAVGFTLLIVAAALFYGAQVGSALGGVSDALDEALVPTAYSMAAFILIRGLRRDADRAEEASRLRVALRADAAAAANAALAESEGRRLVHDRVIGALRRIESGKDVATAVSACQDAMSALAALDPATSADALRSALRACEGSNVHLEDGSWPFAPPARVITAMRESASEAIRNAERHSGVEDVHVRLVATPRGQAGVIVQDSGRGFDPEAFSPGFGVTESIIGRMHQVGGESEVASLPGRGTTVSLMWPAATDPGAGVGSTLLRPSNRTGRYLLMFGTALVPALYYAMKYPLESLNRAWSLALVLLMLAVSLACAHSVGRQQPTWPLVGAVLSFNAIVTWIGLSAASPDVAFPDGSWVVFVCCVTIAYIVIEGTLLQALAVGVAETVTIAAFAFYDPVVTLVDIGPALVQPALFAVPAYIVGLLLRRGWSAVATQEALFEARVDEAGWIESIRFVQRRIADQFLSDVMPFLADYAAKAPATTPALRREAAALGASCRDLLAHDEGLPQPLRGAVLAARRDGMTISLRSATEFEAAACALLMMLLQEAPDADAITLIPARSGAPARVTVIPAVRTAVAERVKAEFPRHELDTEDTDYSTSFIMLSPEWAATGTLSQGIGFTS